MKLTNNHELPDYLVRWLEFDDYDYVEGVVSATGLLSSPRQIVLKERHHDILECDVSEFIARRVGTAIHNSFEDVPMPRIKKEKRVVCEIGEHKISGKYDMLKELTHGIHRIVDIKTTKVGNYAYATTLEEWKVQLSIYKYILEHDGWEIVDGEWIDRKAIEVDNFAEICLYFTDWNRGRSYSDKKYPQIAVGNTSTPLFAEEVIEGFILERLEAIEKARKLTDDKLPFCDDEELWKEKDKWEVLKDGNIRPKLFDTEVAANIHSEHLTSTSGKECTVTLRPGMVKACGFCDARSKCNQMPQLVEEGLLEVKE